MPVIVSLDKSTSPETMDKTSLPSPASNVPVAVEFSLTTNVSSPRPVETSTSPLVKINVSAVSVPLMT